MEGCQNQRQFQPWSGYYIIGMKLWRNSKDSQDSVFRFLEGIRPYRPLQLTREYV